MRAKPALRTVSPGREKSRIARANIDAPIGAPPRKAGDGNAGVPVRGEASRAGR